MNKLIDRIPFISITFLLGLAVADFINANYEKGLYSVIIAAGLFIAYVMLTVRNKSK